MSSRWSRAFYGYLATICAGSCNKITNIKQLEEMKSLIDSSSKGTQLELFLSRRFNWCPNDNNALLETTDIFWKMFVYELLYLWNTLASCNTESIYQIIAGKPFCCTKHWGMYKRRILVWNLLFHSLFLILVNHINFLQY